MHDPLSKASGCLADDYDTALLDLDGVVYISDAGVPGVSDALHVAHNDHGMALTYVTNNAARSSATVAEHLRRLGLPADTDDVVTSAQAGAAEMAKLVPPGSIIFVLGSPDLAREIELVGLTPTQNLDDDIDGLIQGYWPDMPWRMLGQASGVLSRGVVWVATNMDLTIPTTFGLSPGNGAMVNALAHAVGRRPVCVAGKPFRPLMEHSINRTNAQRPLVIGDRLDTDIEGAWNVEIDSLLVFSGVTSVAEYLAAKPEHRPTYIGWNATNVLDAHPVVEVQGQTVSCNGWTVRDGDLVGQGDALDAIRVAGKAVWAGVVDVSRAEQLLSDIGIDTRSAKLAH